MIHITKQLKIMLLKKDMKQVELAEKMGYTKQGFNKLLAKDDFKLKDIVKVSEIMGYEVSIIFTDKESGEQIVVE